MNTQRLIDIAALRNQAASKSSEARRLLDQSREIKRAVRNEQVDVIEDMLKDFLEDFVLEGYKADRYVRDNINMGSAFLRFVDKKNSEKWRGGLTDKHGEAVKAFTQARRNLNRVFLEELRASVDEYGTRGVAEAFGLKNLKNVGI